MLVVAFAANTGAATATAATAQHKEANTAAVRRMLLSWSEE
jgi:hypothetical protein